MCARAHVHIAYIHVPTCTHTRPPERHVRRCLRVCITRVYTRGCTRERGTECLRCLSKENAGPSFAATAKERDRVCYVVPISRNSRYYPLCSTRVAFRSTYTEGRGSFTLPRSPSFALTSISSSFSPAVPCPCPYLQSSSFSSLSRNACMQRVSGCRNVPPFETNARDP